MRPTIESERLSEGQDSDVSAVVVNVSIYKGQVAAVVNNGLNLRYVGIDRFIVDGAQQHTPAINKAIPPSIRRAKIGELWCVFLCTQTSKFTCKHYVKQNSRQSSLMIVPMRAKYTHSYAENELFIEVKLQFHSNCLYKFIKLSCMPWIFQKATIIHQAVVSVLNLSVSLTLGSNELQKQSSGLR